VGVKARLIAWYIGSTGTLPVLIYLGVMFTDGGFTPAQAAMALLLVPLGNLLGAPLWSWVVDRTGARRTILRGATGLSALGAWWMLLAHDTVGLLVGLAVFSFSRSPMAPVTDALTVEVLGDDHREYGRIRAWGSTAFIGAAWVGGEYRAVWPEAPLAVAVVFATFTAVVAWGLPAVPLSGGSGRSPWRLVSHPVVGPLLAVCFLHGLTLAHYDSLYAVLVESEGWPPSVVGWSVALGVSVEVALMVRGRRMMDRFGPATVLAAGVAAAVPRWWLIGTVEDPTWMIWVQASHGLVFGAFWIGGVAMLAEHAPAGLRNTSQSVLPAASFGAGRLAALGLASASLDHISLRQLFKVDAGISVLAAMLAVWLAVRVRRISRP